MILLIIFTALVYLFGFAYLLKRVNENEHKFIISKNDIHRHIHEYENNIEHELDSLTELIHDLELKIERGKKKEERNGK